MVCPIALPIWLLTCLNKPKNSSLSQWEKMLTLPSGIPHTYCCLLLHVWGFGLCGKLQRWNTNHRSRKNRTQMIELSKSTITYALKALDKLHRNLMKLKSWELSEDGFPRSLVRFKIRNPECSGGHHVLVVTESGDSSWRLEHKM